MPPSLLSLSVFGVTSLNGIETNQTMRIEQFVVEPGERASIDFVGEPSDHFAVSYRQCSLDDPQLLQIQYSEKLNYTPFLGGCIYVSLLSQSYYFLRVVHTLLVGQEI